MGRARLLLASSMAALLAAFMIASFTVPGFWDVGLASTLQTPAWWPSGGLGETVLWALLLAFWYFTTALAVPLLFVAFAQWEMASVMWLVHVLFGATGILLFGLPEGAFGWLTAVIVVMVASAVAVNTLVRRRRG